MGTSSEDTVVTVSETAADALDLSVNELPPLSNAIDPNALATLVNQPGVTVTFQYAGLNLVIHSPDTVFAQPIGEKRDKQGAWASEHG